AERNGDRYLDLCDAVALQRVAGAAVDVPELRDAGARQTLRVVEHRTDRRVYACTPLALQQCAPPRRARGARRQLRPKVAAPLVGCAHVGEQEAKDVLVERT